MPANAVRLEPIARNTLALDMAKMALHATVIEPTQDSVEADDRPSATRAPWITPHAYVVPTNQKHIAPQAATATQP